MWGIGWWDFGIVGCIALWALAYTYNRRAAEKRRREVEDEGRLIIERLEKRNERGLR